MHQGLKAQSQVLTTKRDYLLTQSEVCFAEQYRMEAGCEWSMCHLDTTKRPSEVARQRYYDKRW